ncbi:MAG: hypothetical protein IJR52_12320 [Selenomonadaceae bacterium]|nr:hypothetical protein [Selenomonadaceae bacterium]MBQ9498340.1 hypothetical protein [Selenomonadaceae bacterium]
MAIDASAVLQPPEIFGKDGNDTLIGGKGNDSLSGGASKYIPIYYGEGNKNIAQKYIPRS